MHDMDELLIDADEFIDEVADHEGVMIDFDEYVKCAGKIFHHYTDHLSDEGATVEEFLQSIRGCVVGSEISSVDIFMDEEWTNYPFY